MEPGRCLYGSEVGEAEWNGVGKGRGQVTVVADRSENHT